MSGNISKNALNIDRTFYFQSMACMTIKNSIFNDLQIQVSKYIKGLTLNNVECKATENGLEIECEVEIDERI